LGWIDGASSATARCFDHPPKVMARVDPDATFSVDGAFDTASRRRA
jgi:hypothetical protein